MRKRLSVVVPMYNVELFLEEALDTLLLQNVSSQEMQVILIDDGSKDKTGVISQKYVKKYPEFFEYHLFENGGLGASRNRGTRLANSEYITYFDPDDKIVEGSYRKALDILQDTQSDILIGGTKRFNSKKVWNSWIHSRAVTRDLENVTFSSHPELVWDSTAWNKLYRLDFLRDNNIYTPEGILYEDMPMVVPALTLAHSIDVMSDTMYMWRSRDFGTPSITQMSSNDTKPLIDRLFAMTKILKELSINNASDSIVEAQMSKFLNFDIMVMFDKDKFELFSSKQKKELFTALKNFLRLFNEDQLSKSNFHDLVYYKRVLEAKSVSEFSEITLTFLRQSQNYWGYWKDDEYYLASDISDLTKKASLEDFKLFPKIEDVNFGNDILHINGYFYAQFSDMSSSKLVKNPRISIVDAQQNVIKEQIGEVTFHKNHRITATYGYNKSHFGKNGADFNYDYSEYTIEIKLTDFNFSEEIAVNLVLSVEIDGIEVKEVLKNPIGGIRTRPSSYVSDNNNVYSVSYDTNSWVMNISNKRNVNVIKKTSDDKLEINTDYDDVFLVSGNQKLKLKIFNNELIFPVGVQRQLKRFDKSVRKTWSFVRLPAQTGIMEKVYYKSEPKNYHNDTSLEMTYANDAGEAIHKISWVYPLINDIKIENNYLKITFSLTGWLKEAQKVQILADPKVDLIWETEKLDIDKYLLNLQLTKAGFGSKEWLNFHVRLTFQDGYQTDELLRWDKKQYELKNRWFSSDNVGWLIWDVNRFEYSGFALKRTADRVYRQRKIGEYEIFLETEYQKWLEEPLLEKTIVWTAYWGKNNKFGSNPGALYEYFITIHPDYQNIIVMEDAICDYSELYPDAKIISFNTKEYWYYMARAKYFINDVNFEEYAREKRSGQIEIQTMHGTPLKTMGFDVPSEWTDKSYNAYQRRNNSWDYLIVPSDYVAEIATKAYRVNPKLLKTGYPRNDKLLELNKHTDVKLLKEKLNLPQNKKIVLYSPTWRKKGETDINDYLNIESMYKAIPEDTLILIKPHPFESWTNLDGKYQDKLKYAPENASIENLYVISEAVITDYSSVMFDFALLNKPMIFYAFDYQNYIDNRGLNIELDKIAPGPFIQKQSELEFWISNFATIQHKYKKEIDSFKQRFCQYDDGHASQKIVDTIWS